MYLNKEQRSGESERPVHSSTAVARKEIPIAVFRLSQQHGLADRERINAGLQLTADFLRLLQQSLTCTVHERILDEERPVASAC